MSEASATNRIAILISGRGSNMVALAEAVVQGTIPNAEVAVVISDQPNAAGLQKAAELGIETLLIERRGRPRAEHDREVVDALRQRQIDLVCLAGYMRVLSAEFISAYRGRILNIHPSLLPLFPGLDAQKQALDHGAKVSGCTVHHVDETLDLGPIIAQREVSICEDETVESLSQKILIEEHQLYPEAVNIVLGTSS
jgi:phosphoribosylglycinamide formyltransferase, formyltetrahydrofolate-dependent